MSVFVFSLILLNRSPNILRPLSISLRTGFGSIIPITALVVYAAFRVSGRIGEMLALSATMALFAFPLAGLWASGQSQTTVLSGLIPLFDAREYYTDALRLLAGQDFSVVSARRPLFPALMSVLLAITDRNLMLTLAILTAITSFACYLAVREIQRTHGPEVAAFILMFLFLFYRLHTGITMTENLGVALGALGFGLLWQGVSNQNQIVFGLGLLVTTLALNARAGAFLMLPLLVAWAGGQFRKRDSHFSWKAILLSATAVIIGFTLNFLMVRLLATPAGVPFANFTYSFYGLAAGGKSWAYIYEAHPEVLSLQEPEQSQKIYQLAFQLIREKPWQLVMGALYNWKMLFSNTWYNVYFYIGGESWKVIVIARWGLYFLSVLGLIRCLHKFSDLIHQLVFLTTLGVFISVPFLPPTDAYRMRPYAASIIVLGALPAMGFRSILDALKKKIPEKATEIFTFSSMSIWYSLILISVILIGAPFVKTVGALPEVSQISCPVGNDPILIHFDPGTVVNIMRQNNPALDWMPNFHDGSLRANAHSLVEAPFINWLGTLQPLYSVFYTMDYLANRPVMIVTETDLLPTPGKLAQACGTWEHSMELDSYDIFYASEFKQISQFP